MRSGQNFAALSQQHCDLKRTAGIGADEQFRIGGQHVVDFALTNLPRALRLDQVVDAGAPTALIAVGNVTKLDAWNLRQQLARLRPDPLRVREMTRIVIRRFDFQRMALGARAKLDQKLGDVFDWHLPPLLHPRSAAGGINDDRIDVRALDRLDGFALEALRFPVATRMRGKRAAAAEVGRDDDVAAFSGEHADRCFVD